MKKLKERFLDWLFDQDAPFRIVWFTSLCFFLFFMSGPLWIRLLGKWFNWFDRIVTGVFG